MRPTGALWSRLLCTLIRRSGRLVPAAIALLSTVNAARGEEFDRDSLKSADRLHQALRSWKERRPGVGALLPTYRFTSSEYGPAAVVIHMPPAEVERRSVRLPALRNLPRGAERYRAVHEWGVANGFVSAFPDVAGPRTSGPTELPDTISVIGVKSGRASHESVSLAELKVNASDCEECFRGVDRWAVGKGHVAAFPTFTTPSPGRIGVTIFARNAAPEAGTKRTAAPLAGGATLVATRRSALSTIQLLLEPVVPSLPFTMSAKKTVGRGADKGRFKLETTLQLSASGALDITTTAHSESYLEGFTGTVYIYLVSDENGNRLPWWGAHTVGANLRSGSTEHRRFTVPHEQLAKSKAIAVELLHTPDPEGKFRHFANVILKDAAAAAKHIGEIVAEGAKLYAASSGS